MAPRRRPDDWSAGELTILFVACSAFFLSLLPAVADARLLIGAATGLRPFDPRGLSPFLGVSAGSFLTVFWCMVRVDRRGADRRRRRRLMVIASQIREAREEAERRRLIDEQADMEKRRERRVSIASTLFMVSAVGIVTALLYR